MARRDRERRCETGFVFKRLTFERENKATMTLTQILTQVAEGKLSVAEAEKLIRRGPPRPQRQRAPLVVGLIFVLAGSVAAAVGIGIGIHNWSFASSARETEGTVIRLVVTGKRGTAAPIVRYEVGEKFFEIQGGVSSSPPAHAVGEKVTILYHPDQPHQGNIKSFMDQWFLPLIFGGLGTLFVVIGCAVIVSRLRAAPLGGPSA
jgi:Protein of unknown function (DUF3592)